MARPRTNTIGRILQRVGGEMSRQPARGRRPRARTRTNTRSRRAAPTTGRGLLRRLLG